MTFCSQFLIPRCQDGIKNICCHPCLTLAEICNRKATLINAFKAPWIVGLPSYIWFLFPPAALANKAIAKLSLRFFPLLHCLPCCPKPLSRSTRNVLIVVARCDGRQPFLPCCYGLTTYISDSPAITLYLMF